MTEARQAARSRPRLEALESRCVPSTLPATSSLDDVNLAGTLRYAVAHAADGDTIVLKGDATTTGVTLTHGELILTQRDLTIKTQAGMGSASISGDNLSRVFEVASGANVTLQNLTITGGNG